VTSKWHQVYANNVTVATNVAVTGNVNITTNLDVNGDTDIAGAISNEGTTVIGANAKLHANNTISNDTLTNAMLANPSFTIRDGAAGTTDAVNLGETLQFTEGSGIDITVAANELTIAGEDATTSTKGVASFANADFSVTSGAVSIKTAGISTAQLANTMTAGATRGNATQVPTITVNKEGQVTGISHANVAGVSGFTYTSSNNHLRISTADGVMFDETIDAANTTVKGVASFDSGDFSVTSGAVALKDASTGAVLGISATANETTVSRTNGTVTVGLPDNVTIGNSLNVTNSVVIGGDLTVSGNTITVNTETINLADNIIVLNSNETGAPSQDGGISIERGTSADKTLLWDETADKWTVGSETMVAGTFEGAVTGNADTATALATARTIGGVSFDGTANINLAGVNAIGDQDTIGNANTATQLATSRNVGVRLAGDVSGYANTDFDGTGNVLVNITTTYNNDVVLGTDTSGNYVATVTGGTGLTSTAATTGEGTTHSLSVDADQRSNITQIGVDTNDYYKINATTHDWYLDGVLDMRLENDGDLHCDGDVIAYSTTTASDIKLKENITPVENALDKVKQLTGVEFDWKKDGSRSAGVIAQDVEKVLPQAVKTVTGLNTDEEHKVVNYDSLHALLIEAIKELSAEVETLKGNK
jgi:hypothetical protein